MEKQGFKRKLTAILSADVEGYSRLMGDDEEATVQTITAYREVITTLIQQHNGKVVDSPGDNLMAEFVSVVDAVQCAVSVQKEIKARNEELSENRRMQFRIGINLGDVIQEEERIYGDGVNIAARLEGLAEAGGICISKTAFDHIESKLPYGYEFLGDQSVKNIARPVGAYRVLMEPRVTVAGEVDKVKESPAKRKKAILVGIAAAFVVAIAIGIWQFSFRGPSIKPISLNKVAYQIPDNPSIAVLPFVNLSGDPDQDIISDGLSENIISTLSQIENIFVIDRSSTLTFKGKAVKAHQIGEELGVRYVLEGSVQRSKDQIRVTAQLIDALSGYHIWSEKYDRKITDFFQILDDITHKIVVSLQAKLTHGEQVKKWYGTTNFEAWLYSVKGWGLFEKYSKTSMEESRQFFKEAIKIDPNYAFAHVALAWSYAIPVRFGMAKNPSEDLKKAIEIAKKAKEIDDNLSDVHALWNTLYFIQRQYEKAIIEGQRSIELNPNSAMSYVLYAQTMFFAGNFEDALTLVEKALRLSPYAPYWYLTWYALTLRYTERYQEALEVSQKLLERANKGEYRPEMAHLSLLINYALMGNYDKARYHWAEMRKANPNFSPERFIRSFYSFFKNPAHIELNIDAIKKAGLL